MKQKTFPNSIYPNYSNNLQEIKCLITDQETILENKMTFLNKELVNVYELGKSKLLKSVNNSSSFDLNETNR